MNSDPKRYENTMASIYYSPSENTIWYGNGWTHHEDIMRNHQVPYDAISGHYKPGYLSLSDDTYHNHVGRALAQAMSLNWKDRKEDYDPWHFGSEAQELINGNHRFTNYLGRTVDLKTTPWELGLYGKGMVLDGKTHIWAQGTQGYSDKTFFDPHHDGIFEYERGEPENQQGWKDYYDAPKFYIGKDGSVEQYRSHNLHADMEPQWIAGHPDLWVKQNPEWDFTSATITPYGDHKLVELEHHEVRDADEQDQAFGVPKWLSDRRPFVYHQPDNEIVVGPPGTFHSQIDPNGYGQAGAVLFGPHWGDSKRVRDIHGGMPDEVMDAVSQHYNLPREPKGWDFTAKVFTVEDQPVALPTGPADSLDGEVPFIYSDNGGDILMGQANQHHNDIWATIENDRLLMEKFTPPLQGWIGSDLIVYGQPPCPDWVVQQLTEYFGEELTNEKGDTWTFKGAYEPEPPTPADPGRYNKALTINGEHHLFDGDKSHIEEVFRRGFEPRQVEHYWAWSPYSQQWENFNKYKQDYIDIGEVLKEKQPQRWDFQAGFEIDKKAGLWDTVKNVYNRFERGPQVPVPSPQAMAQGKMCYFHPDKPAVAATAFAPMCQGCYQHHLWKTQRPFQAAFDDPYPATSNSDDEPDPDEMHEQITKQLDDDEILHLVDDGVELGHEGKALGLPDSSVIEWETDEFGVPHHQDVLKALGYRDLSGTKFYYVERDGSLVDYEERMNDWNFAA